MVQNLSMALRIGFISFNSFLIKRDISNSQSLSEFRRKYLFFLKTKDEHKD